MHQILILTLWVFPRQFERIVFTVRYVDSTGQIHLEETDIVLISGAD